MSITFKCQSCGKTYQVSEAMVGKKVRCRGCAAVLTVPDAPATRTESPPPPASSTGRPSGDVPEPPSRPRPAASTKPTAPPPPPPPPSKPKAKPVPMFLEIDDDDDVRDIAAAGAYEDLGDMEEAPPLPASAQGRGRGKGRSGAGTRGTGGGLEAGHWLKIGGIAAAVVVPLLLIALFVAGSGSSPLKKHRAVSSEGIAVVEELATLLGEVRDADSARRVGPRAAAAAQKLATLSRRASDLPVLSGRDATRLREEYEGLRQSAIEQLREEVARLRGLPEARSALAPVVMALSY